LGQVFFPPFSFFSLPLYLSVCFRDQERSHCVFHTASRRSSFHSLAFPSHTFLSHFPLLLFSLILIFCREETRRRFIVRQGNGGPKKRGMCFPLPFQLFYIFLNTIGIAIFRKIQIPIVSHEKLANAFLFAAYDWHHSKERVPLPPVDANGGPSR
jgi:hypothetical protein